MKTNKEIKQSMKEHIEHYSKGNDKETLLACLDQEFDSEKQTTEEDKIFSSLNTEKVQTFLEEAKEDWTNLVQEHIDEKREEFIDNKMSEASNQNLTDKLDGEIGYVDLLKEIEKIPEMKNK